ncbi:hypothetical protein EG346_04665 [Chryseobacterium carnipullorum]|uniref:DUF4595 domain-containing protein n=1 Tax=Chryseobacterium carnipullorum TaxID=1124835 RepID=A0A1M7CEP9_CHRCU|nr:hypothetical protein [Chryseobacterium carnipullorum]AZA47522.1 hypothetical protein EG346_04665 [Chryseobacterium carnipullorum]AZA66855.1 hypothetical protein EG345_20800 [Chryseobacterium carnipullorum]SHL65692.1 hypothetical protein SAMN05444360_103188 [Chryseobacterium carnipullorum]STD10314.1 Uncharacterised protein [Chryseobacterium carnipullorum]HBV16948.1 hypothetical protein [Chryseobacterium carnipullorum]
MGKNYLFKVITGVVFGLLVSCDNSSSDQFEPSANNGGNNGNTTPPPARVLEKITLNNNVQEEYTVNGTVFQKGMLRDGVTNNYYTGTATYINNKIGKIKFVGSLTGSMAYDFSVSEDSKGNVYSATCTATAAAAIDSFVSDYTFTYDATGKKLVKILEKRKVSGNTAYSLFTESTFTYNGDNIFKAECTNGTLTGTGAPNMTTAKLTVYSFQNYDSKVNPFSTLPKTFFTAWSLIRPENFYRISPNNPTSVFVMPPSPASGVNTPMTYVYDAFNYPVSDKDQVLKYAYRTL